MRRALLMMRQAISPRLAIKMRLNIAVQYPETPAYWALRGRHAIVNATLDWVVGQFEDGWIGDIVALVEANDARPGKRGPYRKNAALLMSAFKIPRSCLLLSGLFYLSALVLVILESIRPGLTIVATAFASLALAISAVAC